MPVNLPLTVDWPVQAFWEYLWRFIFGGPPIAPELVDLAPDLPASHLVMVENPWLEAYELPPGVLLRNQSCYWRNATRGSGGRRVEGDGR